MSASVESRIVYMQFDNADFERKSKQTLQTLENLQNGLDMEEAAKKFEKLDDAANSVNLKGLTQSVTTLTQSFSAGEIMAKRFFENVTDWAMSATDKLMQMSKVDIVGGWNKYNQELQGVQTIFSALPDETDEHVQAILDKLLWYTDETSYRYSDLVSNIAKFTNAGVSLEDATTALIGIANLTASAGQNAEAASHAMEAFSKAMARGQFDSRTMMQLSTFNINTKAFADTMYKYGKELGTIQEGAYNSATEALSDAAKWSNNEIVLKTLKEYGVYTDEVYKEYEKTGKMAFEIMRELDATGMELSANAMKRAQETKTLADYVDYIHETIATGWKTTFSTIVGDYHEATEFWSNLAEETYPLITSIRDVRNETAKYFKDMGGREKIVSVSEKSLGILDKTLGILKDSVNETTKEFFGFSLDLDDASTNAEKLYDIFDKLDKKLDEVKSSEGWQTFKTVSSEVFHTIANLGKWGFNTLRKLMKIATPIWNALNGASQTTLGQNLIVLLPIIAKFANKLTNLNYAISPLGLLMGFLVKSFVKFSDSLVEFANDISGDFTPAINGAFNILKKIYEFIDAAMDYLMPIWKVIGAIVKLVVQAFHIIATAANKVINKLPFTSWLKNATEQGSAFASICDKIAAAINWVTKKLHDLFFGYDDVSNAMNETGESGVKHMMGWLNYIDKAMKKLHDWWEGLSGFKKVFYDFYEVTKNTIKNTSWSTLGESFKKYWTEVVPAFLKRVANSIKNWWKTLSSNKDENFKIGAFTVEGFIEGVKSAAVKIWGVLKSIFSKVITFVMDIFDIHSPSKIFAAIGAFVIAGFIGGILSSAKDMNKTTGEVFSSFTDSIKKMFDYKDPQGAMGGALGSVKGFFGIIGEIFKQFYDFVKEAGNGNVFAGVLDIFRQFGEAAAMFGIGDAGKGLKKMPKALSSAAESLSKITDFNFELKAEGTQPPKKGWGEQFKELGKGLLLMVAAFALLAYTVSKFDQNTIDTTLLVLAAIIGGFTALAGLTNNNTSAFTKDIGTIILKVAASILIIAMAFKKIIKAIDKADDPNSWWKATIVIGIMVVAMVGVIKYLTMLQSKTKGIGDQSFKSIGLALLAVSAAMLIMAMAFKKILKVIDKADNPNAWWQALLVMGLMVAAAMGFFALMVYLKTKGDKKGRTTEPKTFIKFAEAFLIMTAGIYIIAMAMKKIMKTVDKYGAESAFAALMIMVVIMAAIGGLFIAAGKLKLKADTIKAFSISAVIFAAAMYVIARAMQEIMKIDGEGMLKSLLVLVVVSGILLGIGAAAGYTKIGDGLVKFGKAIEYFGLGLLAAAAAFYIGAAATMKLFKTLVYASKHSDAIKKGLGATAEVISGLMVAILKGLARGVKEILPTLIEIGVNLIVGTIEGMADSAKQIGTALFKLINVVLDLFIEHIPEMSSKITEAFVKMLKGLAEGFGEIDPEALATILSNVTAITAILGEMSLWPALLIPAAIGDITTLFIPDLVDDILDMLVKINDIDNIDGKLEIAKKLFGKFGEICGEFMGNFLGKTGEVMSSFLPTIGEHLVKFAEKMVIFSDKIKNVDDSAVNSGFKLAALLGVFSAVEFLEAISKLTELLTFTSLPQMGADLADFAIQVDKYVQTVSAWADIDKVMDATGSLVGAIIMLGGAKLLDAIETLGSFGLNKLVNFDLKKTLTVLGEGVMAFAESVKGIAAEHVYKIQTMAKAAGALALVLINLDDGVWEKWTKTTTEDDAKHIKAAMEMLAAGLVAFYEKASEIGNLDNFDKYVTKLVDLINAMKQIPNAGVLAKLFSGDYDFYAFALGMGQLGMGLRSFYSAFEADTTENSTRFAGTALELVNGVDLKTLSSRVGALKEFIAALNEFGTDGGVWHTYWNGSKQNALNALADGIKNIGWAIRDYYVATEDKEEIIKNMTTDLGGLIALFDSDDKINRFARFATVLTDFTKWGELAKKSGVIAFVKNFAASMSDLATAVLDVDLSKFEATLSLINTVMDDLPSDPVVTPVLDARDFMTGIALMGRAINGGSFSIDTSGVSQATASMAGSESSSGKFIEITNNYTVDELTELEAYKNTKNTTRLIKIGLK